MKNLLFLSSLIFTFNMCIGQSANTQNTIALQSNTKANAMTSPDETVSNEAVIQELSDHLKKTLVVPERLREFNVEGKSVVNVHLDASGKITQVVVIESLHSLLDKAIIKAFKKVKKVKTISQAGTAQTQIVQLPVIIKY